MERGEPIYIPSGTEYLEQVLDRLPVGYIFNKGITGCGGTDLAITQSGDTIIAMPNVSGVINKATQFPNARCPYEVLRVYGIEGMKEQPDNIVAYVNRVRANGHPIKIAVTYDSLPRLIGVLTRLEIDVYNDIFLLVDEYHVLFNAYNYRYRAIRELLKEAEQFANVTYMSATPIIEEFMFEQLKKLPIKEAIWEDKQLPKVHITKVSSSVNWVAMRCKDLIATNTEYNYHIFVNSISMIRDIVNRAHLTPDNTRIICSTSGDKGKENRERVKKFGHSISTLSNDTLKKVNFYTSTCFEGCDIYDPVGKTIVVCNGNPKCERTLVDIPTVFTQICGRLRNSTYKDEVELIFSPFYADYKYEPYKAMILERYNAMVSLLDKTKDAPQELRLLARMLTKREHEFYACIGKETITGDINFANLDLRNFNVYMSYVKTGRLQNIFFREGFVNGQSYPLQKHSAVIDEIIAKPNCRKSFEELYKPYAAFMRAGHLSAASIIATKNELVKRAYEKLIYREIEDHFKFDAYKIKRELEKTKYQ